VNAALGLKAHSGWASLVVLGFEGRDLHVVDRRRLELVDPADASWSKAPYHAAEKRPPAAARELVRRGVEAARRIGARQIRAVARRLVRAGHPIAACAVLVGEPMPAWSVDEILAVHFRMHRAEGALFQDVLAAGARACGVSVVPVFAKELEARAKAAFGARTDDVLARIKALGKSAGPPWGKDQKDAALAAAIAAKEKRSAGS
jgi:hypothetical protein